MSRFALRFFAVLSALTFAALCAYAQYSGNIVGVVMDPTGAAIAKASVQLRNVDTGVTESTTSGASGNYSFSNLAPGNYVVTASANGFKASEVHFTLSTAQLQSINITMPLASVSASVTVTTEAPPVDISDTRLQTTLSSATVQDLPEKDRNLWDVMAVQPGVVGAGTNYTGEAPGGLPDNFGTQTPQISANGRSYTGNVVFVDGLNVTSPVQNGNLILAPVPDAIQEASLQTNSFDAENNLGSSAFVQITTKSGTNQYHGTGDLFYTDQHLDAVEPFSAAVSPYARKDLTGTLGGPVIKDKLFFFADVEKLWSKYPESASGQVRFNDPAFTTWAGQNFASNVGTQVLQKYPGTFFKSTGVVANAQQYTGLPCTGGNVSYSAPNGNTATIPCTLNVEDAGSFVFSPYYNALQYNFRGDYYVTPNDRLYVSYYNDGFDWQQPDPHPALGAANIMRNRYGQVDFSHTFNSNLQAEGAIGFASVGGANGQPVAGQNLSVPEVAVGGGVQGWGIGSGWGPGEFRGPNYNWRAVLNWVHGAHSFKFGYEGDHAIEHGDFTPVNVRPAFSFTNLIDVVLDSPQNETVGAYNPLTGKAGYVVFGGQENPFGFFAQDNWKATPNLTLTLALRWDDFTNHSPWADAGCGLEPGAPYNGCFRFSDIVLGSGSTRLAQITGASVVQRPDGLFTSAQSNYWSPRIGVAWDPTGHAQWVVRGGIGVYRDWVTLGQSVDQMRNNPPSVLSETFCGTGSSGCSGVPGVLPDFAFGTSPSYPWNFPLPSLGAGNQLTLNSRGGYQTSSGTPIPTGVDSLAPNLVPPLAVNYTIGLERQLPAGLVGTVSYSGSHAYDALTGTNWNRCAGCGATLPNGFFGGMVYVTNSNAETYNAMVLAIRRNGRRSNFQASYTLSHAMDYPEAGTRFDQDGGLNIPDPAAYFSYWSDANWDVRQRFSFSGLYRIPGAGSGIERVLTDGWEVSSIAAVQTGTPYWVTCDGPNYPGPGGALIPCDFNGDSTNYDVPNAPSANYSGSYSRTRYESGIFPNSMVFAPPPAGTEGNLKRNTYRNPGFVELDASLLKNTHVPWFGEAGNFQLRFDFLNFPNITNLGPVVNDLSTCTSIASGLCTGAFGRVVTPLSATSKRQIDGQIRIAF